MRTAEPKIGQAFSEWMVAQDHHKDHAGLTTFRFSGVMGCTRQLGYYAAGAEESDPMDGSSLAVTAMGSLLHEDIQAAIAIRWPDATFEGRGQVGDLISGHYDVDLPDDDELIEIKTVGAYKFDLSIGLFRSPGKGQPARLRTDGGKGPSLAHICQGGFNAAAHGRSRTVRIVYVSREAVSVQKADEAGLGPIERFWAEWTFGREVWEPLVKNETERLAKIRALVADGQLPDRSDLDDNAKPVKIDIDTHWRCKYCSFAQRCKMDGPGRIAIPRLKLVES